MSLTIIAVSQLATVSILYLYGKGKYQETVKKYGGGFQLSFFAPVSLTIIDKTKLMERLSKRIIGIHHKIVNLYGSKNGYIYTKLFLGQLISAVLLILLIFSFFGAVNSDFVIFYYGLFIAILTPFLLLRSLDKAIKKRKEEILIELPELLNKIILLVNAGETVPMAVIRSVEQKKEAGKSFLYKELLVSVNQLKNNDSFSRVLEELNKRIGVQEVAIFTTTILLNYRRGGDEFVAALRILAKDLWEKRKSLARTLGEQASSKLVFPMVLIFVVIMVVIATPAILLF